MTLARRDFLRATAVGGASVLTGGCESAVRLQRRADRGGRGGGTLNIGSLTDLDPGTLYSQSITSMTVGLLLYDTLIRYDRRTLAPQPAVATSWAVAADGLHVTLRLRPDVHFHSGRPLTSADVANTIRTYAAVAAGSQLRSTATAVVAVDTADPSVAVLHLAAPTPNLFDLLEFMLLVDSAAAPQPGALPGGTGPFALADRRIGERTVLRRNERYWRGPASVDGVTIRVVRDSGALLTSVRARQTDLVLDASPQALRPFRDGDRYRVESEDVYDVAYYVGCNVADARLADKRVRQAISYSIDRTRLAREEFRDRGVASAAPWARSSPAYQDSAARHYTRDLARARALLAAAGPAHAPLVLSYPTGLAVASNIAAIVADNLADVGMTVVLDPREQSTFSPFLRSGAAQLWLGPHGFGHLDPVTLATSAAPFTVRDNLSRFSSPEYTAAVARLASLRGPGNPEAGAAYRAYTDLLLDEQFVIDLVITTATNVSPAAVRGLAWNMYKNIDAHAVTVR